MSDDPASHDAFKWEQRMEQIKRLLTPWEAMGDMANAERRVAALTIENLMEEVEAWQQAMRKAERDIAQLRAERDEARRERDDARRWICRDRETHSISAQEIADANDWTCFEEEQ